MHLNLKPPRVFYGWWIVGACFLIALYMGGVVFYGFTAIFEPIADEFGWSYAQISFAASIRGLEAGLLAPVFGLLVDRWGPRRLLFGGVFFIGLGLMLLGYTNSLFTFYIASFSMAIGTSSCGMTVTMVAVANWFRRKVGTATGIMIAGYGASGFMVPLMVRLIDLYEWRMAMFILGIGILVMGLPLSLLVRHKPEQYGYLPDGEVNGAVVPGEDLVSVEAIEEGISAKQALKSRTFWHINLALISQFVILAAVVAHVMPYLSSIGIARSVSSLVAMAIPILSMVGRIGFGWFADRFNKERLASIALIMLTLSLLCFEYTSFGWTWLLVPFLIFLGVGYGGNLTMFGVLLKHHFGRKNFGSIVGFAWAVLMLGNVAGPPVAGWVFDTWGSYQNIWLALSGLTTIGAVIMALTPPVSKES
ncbi:MFS transporter [Chloroflexota bacterium]